MFILPRDVFYARVFRLLLRLILPAREVKGLERLRGVFTSFEIYRSILEKDTLGSIRFFPCADIFFLY